MNILIGIIVATVLSLLNFVLIDIKLGLPESPGVKGAEYIGKSVQKNGGDLSGGFMQGNIVCSPDASAGTLLASVGMSIAGIQGGLIVALIVYIGNRLCADPGYAGTAGTLTATTIIFLCSFIGMTAEMFIAGMIIAIFLVQGFSQSNASKVLGNLAKKLNRYTKIRFD